MGSTPANARAFARQPSTSRRGRTDYPVRAADKFGMVAKSSPTEDITFTQSDDGYHHVHRVHLGAGNEIVGRSSLPTAVGTGFVEHFHPLERGERVDRKNKTPRPLPWKNPYCTDTTGRNMGWLVGTVLPRMKGNRSSGGCIVLLVMWLEVVSKREMASPEETRLQPGITLRDYHGHT